MRSVRCAKTSRVSQTALVRCMYPRQSGGNAPHPGQVEDHQQSSGRQLKQATGIHSMASRLTDQRLTIRAKTHTMALRFPML